MVQEPIAEMEKARMRKLSPDARKGRPYMSKALPSPPPIVSGWERREVNPDVGMPLAGVRGGVGSHFSITHLLLIYPIRHVISTIERR